MQCLQGPLLRVLLLLPFILVVACQSDEEKLVEHLSRGDTYFEAEEYAEAIIEYKSALQIDPNAASAHWGLAQAYLKNDSAREGYWELRETARLDPANIEARLKFAQLSIFAGEFEEARKHAEEVIALDPSTVRAYLILGQVHEAQKQTEEAQAAYEAAVAIGPDHEDALSAFARLATFHNRQGDREAAEPFFRKLTEIEPDFSSHFALAGFLSEARDRDDEVEEVYLKGVEVAKADELQRAYAVLSGFYYSRGRFTDAEALLQKAIEELDESLDLIYLLARFYNMEKMDEKADALVEQATLADPEDPRPFMILSTYRARRADMPGALAAVERVLELDPENAQGLLRKSEVLVDMGFAEKDESKIAEGQELVDRLLAENPTDAGALMVRSKIHLAKKSAKDAVIALHAALDARPNWAEAHFLLGSALGMQGDRTAARTELARALELDAGLIDARKVLARVHHSLGEYEYAVEEGRRTLAERPDDIATRIVVAQSLLNLGRRTESVRELEKIPEEQRDASALYALGMAYLVLARPEEARANLMAANEMAPTNPDVLRGLMTLDGREKRFLESVERIDAAIAADPDRGRLWSLKGTAALALGRGDEAEQSFKKAVELSPNDLTGYEMLANFYGRTGRSQQAIETYEKAVEVNPERAQLHYMLGVLYEFTGHQDKAILLYEEAIRRGPELGQAKNNLAYIYADTEQNLDRALDLAQEAKALLPDNPHAADTMGWVLYKRGIPSAAISFLREAESGIPPDDANLGVVRHHLALAYEANEEPSMALETVERALGDLEALAADARSKNRAVGPEPAWATDMRAMRERLQQSAEG